MGKQIVCDCGLRQDEHLFAFGSNRTQCDGYNQKKLSRTYGKDVRKTSTKETENA